MEIKGKKFKAVLWGHKLHSHTHSYIHNAFYRAFKHLGIEAHWFDDNDNVGHFNFENCLFITEGQVDNKIPLRDDCFYVLHNCYNEKYKSRFNKNCTNLQVYTDSVLQYNFNKLEDCIYADYEGRCIYLPWATDLLPHEIDANKPHRVFPEDSRVVSWVGTVGAGQFGNIDQITPFKRACEENGIRFNQTALVSVEENIRLIKNSYLAPAIVGRWQHEVGYIPCRIFKNISYGQMGITNSPRVHELFQHKTVQNSDGRELFYNARTKVSSMQLSELHALMDFVRDRHTYINRINTIIDYINELA